MEQRGCIQERIMSWLASLYEGLEAFGDLLYTHLFTQSGHAVTPTGRQSTLSSRVECLIMPRRLLISEMHSRTRASSSIFEVTQSCYTDPRVAFHVETLSRDAIVVRSPGRAVRTSTLVSSIVAPAIRLAVNKPQTDHYGSLMLSSPGTTRAKVAIAAHRRCDGCQ